MGEISDNEPEYLTAEIVQQHMEDTMKCPHLNRWVVATCRVGEKIYVPSVFQLQEYCKTREHKRCPFFVKNVSENKKADPQIPAREYA
jgi:hypothetical protein